MNSTFTVLVVYGLLFLVSTAVTFVVACVLPPLRNLVTVSIPRILILNLLICRLMLNAIGTSTFLSGILSKEAYNEIIKINLISAVEILDIDLFWYTLIANSLFVCVNRLNLMEGHAKVICMGALGCIVIIWISSVRTALYYYNEKYNN